MMRSLPGEPSAGYNSALASSLQPQTDTPMKADIHPNYHPVVFQDAASDFAFLTRSTMTSDETVKWEDGNEYPVVKVDISSASHPFYTGKQKVMDTGGRIDKFKRRYTAGK
jgi:large subunit ribosomal protein L31